MIGALHAKQHTHTTHTHEIYYYLLTDNCGAHHSVQLFHCLLQRNERWDNAGPVNRVVETPGYLGWWYRRRDLSDKPIRRGLPSLSGTQKEKQTGVARLEGARRPSGLFFTYQILLFFSYQVNYVIYYAATKRT